MNKEDDFYVGYFPMPSRHRRFLKVLLSFMFPLILGLGFLIAKNQKLPGDGQGWDASGVSAMKIQTRLWTKPYGLARFQHKDGSIQTAILTSMIKSGVKKRIKGLGGKAVELTGVMIHKEGRFLFSILDAESAIRVLPAETLSHIPEDFSPVISLGENSLKGEIIDPKCYIGAMKPGGGKTHKACATLCIKGGIPPMFVVRDRFLRETFYLLLTEDGEPILESIIPFIGDLVQAEGKIEKWGDMFVYKLRPESIKRLPRNGERQ